MTAYNMQRIALHKTIWIMFLKKVCYYQLETVRTNFAKEDENKPNENVYILCPAQDKFKWLRWGPTCLAWMHSPDSESMEV